MSHHHGKHPHYHGSLPYPGPYAPAFAPGPWGAHHPGYCGHCGQPMSMCRCAVRECRRESRELLVGPSTGSSEDQSKLELLNAARDAGELSDDSALAADLLAAAVASGAAAGSADTAAPGTDGDEAVAKRTLERTAAAGLAQLNPVAAQAQRLGSGTAFIGGSCCVHLSIEIAPIGPIADPAKEKTVVVVTVRGSDGTLIAWGKTMGPGDGYQIKEDILVTKPGAVASLKVSGQLYARLRWCEVFSC